MDVFNPKRASVYTDKILDYDKSRQPTEYNITLVAHSNTEREITAQATINIIIRNVNDNPPTLLTEFFFITSSSSVVSAYTPYSVPFSIALDSCHVCV